MQNSQLQKPSRKITPIKNGLPGATHMYTVTNEFGQDSHMHVGIHAGNDKLKLTELFTYKCPKSEKSGHIAQDKETGTIGPLCTGRGGYSSTAENAIYRLYASMASRKKTK